MKRTPIKCVCVCARKDDPLTCLSSGRTCSPEQLSITLSHTSSTLTWHKPTHSQGAPAVLSKVPRFAKLTVGFLTGITSASLHTNDTHKNQMHQIQHPQNTLFLTANEEKYFLFVFQWKAY